MATGGRVRGVNILKSRQVLLLLKSMEIRTSVVKSCDYFIYKVQ